MIHCGKRTWKGGPVLGVKACILFRHRPHGRRRRRLEDVFICYDTVGWMDEQCLIVLKFTPIVQNIHCESMKWTP